MESDEIPLVTLIAGISLVQGSEAKSISYQKFNWQPQDSNPSCVDYPDSVNFVPKPSLFNEQLAIIPSETSTRAVFLILPPIRTRALDRSVKTAPRRSGPKTRALDRLLELATLRSDLDTATNVILETRYNTNIKFGLSSSVSDTMAPGASQLGFDFGRSRSTRPRPDLRWIINDSGNFKTVVVYYRVWMGEYDPIINLREEAIQKSADTVTQSLIANWNDFTDLDTKFIELSPID